MFNLLNLVRFDLKSAFASPLALLAPLCLFATMILVFPFAIETKLLEGNLAIALFWTSFIFAVLSSLASIFNNDLQDGTLEQLLMINGEKYNIILSKIISSFLLFTLPITLLMPLFFFFFHISFALLPITIGSFLIGGLAINIIGVLISLLLLGLSSSYILLPFLVFPLILPIIIFSLEIIYQFVDNSTVLNILSNLSILTGIALILLLLTLILGNYFLKNIDSN